MKIVFVVVRDVTTLIGTSLATNFDNVIDVVIVILMIFVCNIPRRRVNEEVHVIKKVLSVVFVFVSTVTQFTIRPFVTRFVTDSVDIQLIRIDLSVFRDKVSVVVHVIKILTTNTFKLVTVTDEVTFILSFFATCLVLVSVDEQVIAILCAIVLTKKSEEVTVIGISLATLFAKDTEVVQVMLIVS